jgi:hypothetical protein
MGGIIIKPTGIAPIVGQEYEPKKGTPKKGGKRERLCANTYS